MVDAGQALARNTPAAARAAAHKAAAAARIEAAAECEATVRVLAADVLALEKRSAWLQRHALKQAKLLPAARERASAVEAELKAAREAAQAAAEEVRREAARWGPPAPLPPPPLCNPSDLSPSPPPFNTSSPDPLAPF